MLMNWKIIVGTMSATKNEYVYPVELTKNVRMTYDESPAHTGRLKHAVDFITPEGTPIKAAADGVVEDVKQDSDISGPDQSYDEHGNYIEIRHANKEFSIYEHIQKNGSLVKGGDKVKAGQVIGYSGNTGMMVHLGPHIHFDVHVYFGKGPEGYETLKIRWKHESS